MGEPEEPDGDFDVVLLHDFEHGDRAAFELLYRRYAPAVLRFAWSLAATRPQADDLLQETFLTLWAKRRGIRLADESVLPWLLVTCRNHARNQRRAALRRRETPLDDAAERPAAEAPDLAWMSEALDTLTPADRRLCELCLVHGYSYKAAAELLELTETAVGKRLQRAKARLRKAVADGE